MRDQLRFIDDDEMADAEPLRVAPDALNISQHDWRIPIPPAEPGRIDAVRRVRPELQEMLEILVQELAYMHKDQCPQIPVSGGNVLDRFSDQHAFAGASGHHNERMATAGIPISVKRTERRL